MDSRMDLSALDRNRLLSSLPPSALGHLGLSALAVSEQSHSSALNRLSAASAAAAAAAGASPPDLARAGSPTAGLVQYPGRYMSSSALHSPGASYAMMAGYFGGSSHIPESFKNLIEFQQYWQGTSQEAYARQLLANIYYPYLPYLPATESLSLFAQNSAAAQVQAAQAHAAHHRIYDLHKEALFGPGAVPGGYYPPSLLLAAQPSSQVEATNLSLSGSSKSKQKEEKDRHKHQETESSKTNDCAKSSDNKIHCVEEDKAQTSDGSERTRGMSAKKSGEDYLKSRSGDGMKKSSSNATSSYETERKRSKLEAVLRQAKETNEDQNSPKLRTNRSEIPQMDKKQSDKLSSPVAYGDYFVPVTALSPSVHTAFHSPGRNDRVISPDKRSSKAHSPIRSQKATSPVQIIDNSQPIQDKPENLCMKDRKSNTRDVLKSNANTVDVITQSVVTGTTLTVTATLNVITSDLSPQNQARKIVKESESSPRHLSPLSSSSSNTTSTTYSLPYYHNLYSRSQSNSQDGKKVHAVTYVPEIGTVSSPFVSSPPITDVKLNAKDENDFELRKEKSDDGKKKFAALTEKLHNHSVAASIPKSSPNLSSNEADSSPAVSKCNRDCGNSKESKDIHVCNDDRTKDKGISSPVDKIEKTQTVKIENDLLEVQEIHTVQKPSLEPPKGKKSVSPSLSSASRTTIDLTNDKITEVDTTEAVFIETSESTENKTEIIENDSDFKSKASAITHKTPVASKHCEKYCDMNHNSKSAKPQSDFKVIHKPQCKNLERQDSNKIDSSHIINRKETLNRADESEKLKKLSKDSDDKTLPEKASETESDSKKLEKSDSVKGTCKDEKAVKSKELEKGSSKEKKDHGPLLGASIPVGIAVARQRNIAPKTEKEIPKTSDDVRGKVAAAAEIKPVRPLKILRPSSKGKPHGATDFRNELPANLIVTGGNNSNSLFWSNDQTSRQLAAQYLQPGTQLNSSSWYGQNHVTFPHSNQASTSESSQMPFSVPPGFELAQNSLTGGILLIPSATDVYDSSRIFPNFQVGTQSTQNYGHSMLTTPQTQATIPAAAATFMNQSSLDGPGQYQLPFSTEVLPRPETSVKEEKREINTQHSADSIITSSVSLTSGQDNSAVSMIVHQDIDKDKIMTVPPPSFVTDLSGQQCAYAFHPPAMPYLFNPSIMPVHSISDSVTEVNNQSKLEHTSVQSRGTSPMLPATDSSNEETEEEKVEKHDEKTESNVNELVHETKVTADLKEEAIASDSVPENEKHTESNVVDESKTDASVKDEAVHIEENSIHPACDERTPETEQIDGETNSLNCGIEKNKSEEQPVFVHLENKPNLPDLPNLQSSIKVIDTNLEKENKVKPLRAAKPDRNIFEDLTEYNPFTDPQILQAADGLELLSALAEKSSLCSNVNPTEKKLHEEPKGDTLKDDIYVFKEDKNPTSKSPFKKNVSERETIVMSPKETKKPAKSRIKCGYAFKPTKTPEPANTSPVRMTTFCGITIPEDDDVIDSIEMEMKMRLMELQRRYREKQKELTKLKPKKDKGKEDEKEKDTISETEKKFDPKRGRGRPKKRKQNSEEDNAINSSSQSPKTKVFKSETLKTAQNGRHTKPHINQHSNSTHSNQSSGSHSNSNGAHGSNKKKKLAEMLVDRVFRKAGSSFKIPLSKKISLIAPARIEFPSATCNNTEKAEQRHARKSLDFRRLIKGSRLSQLNGKDRCFDGGLWRRKEEKRKHSQSSSRDDKQKKPKKHEVESGLGLLAEYATKYREEKDKEKDKEEKKEKDKEEKKEKEKTEKKEKDKPDKSKKKRKTEECTEFNLSSPDSPNKKRKPGRPKKCDLIKPGVTETIVAKQSKHMDFFRWQKDEKPQERKISLEGKAPLKPLYLDEWNVRRSERIFLSDSSPQTSPNTAVSPGVKQKTTDERDKGKDTKRKDNKGKDSKGKDVVVKDTSKVKADSAKKQRSTNLQDLSQKLKKKYSTTFSQKSREKTTELLKARDKLTKKRHTKKLKKLSKSDTKEGSESDASTDDMPLSSLKSASSTYVLPTCIIEKDELQDGLRILIFMDGLFHEGEVKAIRPPDVYGAILDNERRTRPHICSQEEILRDAIKDVKPGSIKQLKEGTRICAYWSQQFSCLYPGTISRASPDPHGDKSLVNVEFDDGDNGKIPLDHIRMIPQDFPIVEYDPHPLLLLTKRRRTLSTSESSEPRISCSNIPPSPKENKSKRGPGRPPKADRLISTESLGDEDVFTNGNTVDKKTEVDEDSKSDKSEKTSSKKQKNEQTVPSTQTRQLWKWSGSSTKKPGLKGKAKKEYYKCIVRGRETVTGALFRSDHEDENDVQTISHKCEVLRYEEFRRRKALIPLDESSNVYYLAGSYQPTIGHIKFEPGVI